MGLKAAGAVKAMQSGLLDGTTYLALFTGTAAPYTEVNVTAYARRSVAESGWENTAPAGNQGVLTWVSPTADDNAALSRIGLYSVLTGGSLLIDGALTGGTVTLQSGSSITAADDAITITLTGGGLTSAGSLRLLKGGFNPSAGTLYMGLHTGQPTTGNEVTGGAYGRVARANNTWTVNGTGVSNPGRLQNATAISWTTPTGTWTDPTHIGVWTALTGGTLLYWDALDDDVSAPVSGATVQIAASGFFIDLAQD